VIDNEYSIIITTTAKKESANTLAKLLVEKRLAAGVQMFPIESVYFWRDEIHEENETILLIISESKLFNEISAAIKESHAYEVPEVVQIPITDGLPDYLKWITNYVRNK
jgi:periplasmic divalent cation tolerance protein